MCPASALAFQYLSCAMGNRLWGFRLPVQYRKFEAVLAGAGHLLRLESEAAGWLAILSTPQGVLPTQANS